MKEKKQRKKSGPINKIIMIVLLCIICFCLYKIGTILYEYHIGSKQYEEVQEIAGTEEFTGKLDWKTLISKNKDIRAWLYSEDTVINYPVVQGDNNDYYLTHMFNGEYNGAGSIFIDYRIDKPFEVFNTIIYGHRMKDGSMFHSLIDYREKDYYNKHKTMELVTKNHKYDVEIFAVDTIAADSDLYEIYFDSYSDKEKYLKKVRKKSELSTDISVSADDKIVMMSTCTYEFDDARLVVYGKLVEK